VAERLQAAEGDSVQWFRAEAEMDRWHEQLEIKQAEFLRCIRSFNRMKEVWNLLAEQQPHEKPGHQAYARQKSAMYKHMENDGREKLKAAGYGALLEEDGMTLVDHILAQRQADRIL
jgi:hypothetical protein